MKFFAVFSAIVAVALASPATWTIQELSEAIQNPNTHVSLIPILEGALNDLMSQVISGSPQTTTTVSTVVQDFSTWTLHELSEAIENPETNPELLPYLEYALNSLISNIMAGENQEYIIVATPVGLLPIDQVPVVPAPIVDPEVPAPAESVVTPAGSPLVQIIVNINSQQQEIAAPVPSPDIVDDGVIPVVDRPVPVPSPIAPIVPSPVILPEPVAPEVVIPEPEIVPNPIDIIAINPETIVNPVDVIAITAPEINPVDILSPVPVVNPVGAVDVVGPLV